MSRHYLVPAGTPTYAVRPGEPFVNARLRVTSRDNTFPEQQRLWVAGQIVTANECSCLDPQTAQRWANLGYSAFRIGDWILLLFQERLKVSESLDEPETQQTNHQPSSE